MSNFKPIKNSTICEVCAAKLSDSCKVGCPIELHIHQHYDGYANAGKERNKTCYSPNHNGSAESYESKVNNGKKIQRDRVKEKELLTSAANNNVARAYLEFECFRANFIKKWCERSSFIESRKAGDTRPVVLIRTNKMLSEFNQDLATDKLFLSILATDPKKFSPKANKFRPISELFKNVTKVSISQPSATNSRKKTKTEVLRSCERGVDRLQHIALTTGTAIAEYHFKIANDEFKAIREDEEEVYRVRTYGYNDTCVYLAQNGSTHDKLRIRLTGMFILDLDCTCIVVTQVKLDPKLAIKSYPVTPINCSAISKGLLYRQSDIDAYNNSKKK